MGIEYCFVLRKVSQIPHVVLYFCCSSNVFLLTMLTEVYLIACPNGTYHDGGVPGDVTMCTPCPDVNHMTLGPATGPRDCVCKRGFVANGPSCESEKSIHHF